MDAIPNTTVSTTEDQAVQAAYDQVKTFIMEDQKRSLEVTGSYEKKMSDLRDKNREELSELRFEYQKKLTQLGDENQQRLTEMQQEAERRLAVLRKENDGLRLKLNLMDMENERLKIKKWQRELTNGDLRGEVRSLTDKLEKSEDRYKETATLQEDLRQSREEVRSLTDMLKKSEDKYKEKGEELKALAESRKNGMDSVAGK